MGRQGLCRSDHGAGDRGGRGQEPGAAAQPEKPSPARLGDAPQRVDRPRARPGGGVFGALKRSYGLARMRYMSLARNATGVLLTLTGWNLARAADRLRPI